MEPLDFHSPVICWELYSDTMGNTEMFRSVAASWNRKSSRQITPTDSKTRWVDKDEQDKIWGCDGLNCYNDYCYRGYVICIHIYKIEDVECCTLFFMNPWMWNEWCISKCESGINRFRGQDLADAKHVIIWMLLKCSTQQAMPTNSLTSSHSEPLCKLSSVYAPIQPNNMY